VGSLTIKLGIIGSSLGNGHPYSWSAIFNGYDSRYMQTCGYPVIPQYLGEQSWPEARIPDAKVVSIWTQDQQLSQKIAKASLIEHISFSLNELNSRVDAVLLARDDAENHYENSKLFLDNGKPIYIDKPIALSFEAFKKLYDLERYEGQIFTCSALRYSSDLSLDSESLNQLGKIEYIEAITPKSWDKYAVHIIEPVLKLLSDDDTIINSKTTKRNDRCSLEVTWNSGVKTVFATLGDVDSLIKIIIHGKRSNTELVFTDTFDAFKNALSSFIDGINRKISNSPYLFNEKVVRLIELGGIN